MPKQLFMTTRKIDSTKQNPFRSGRAHVFLGADEFHRLTGQAVPEGKTCTVVCPNGMNKIEMLKNLKVKAFTTLETPRVLFISINSMV